MAGSIGGSNRRRVFVLVDKGVAQGVFLSWEAAESYADEHRLALDHLMEYETSRDYPDHLHLLVAKWDGDWEFQGEWTRLTPDWGVPPKKIRLDHYYAKSDGFHLLRQKEFVWESGLLEKVNPMAPDTATKPAGPSRPAHPAPQWKPKLAPLKAFPTGPKPEKQPLIPAEDTPEPTEPEKPGIAPEKSLPIPEKAEEAAPATPEVRKPKISFQKRQPLRLKRDAGPKPIPSFKPVAPPPVDTLSGKAAAPALPQTKEPTAVEETAKPKKHRQIWPMRLIVPLLAIPLCWAVGVYWWVLKPEPTAAEIAAGVTSLVNGRKIIIEPEMVFFQLPVEPIQQKRWINSLNMQPIPRDQIMTIPTFHSLETWAKPEGFIRPPYGVVEVEEWWNLRLRKVKFGFFLDWEDGSSLILDLESDTLNGWMRVERVPDVLN